jgi:hypothetical protein
MSSWYIFDLSQVQYIDVVASLWLLDLQSIINEVPSIIKIRIILRDYISNGTEI